MRAFTSVSSRARQLFLGIAVRVGLLCFAVAVGELSLQCYYRHTTGKWLPTESKAFRLTCVAPVPDDREYALRPSYRDADVTVSPLGFRVVGADVPEGSAVVAAMGDSVTFGAGAKDSDTYTALLDRELAGSGVRVLNAGVPSYTIRQSIRRVFIDVLPHYRPRVITLQAANDVSLFDLYGARWTSSLTWAKAKFSDQLPSRWTSVFALFHYANSARAKFRSLGASNPLEAARHHLLRSIKEEVAAFRADPRLAGIPIVLLPIDPFYYQQDRARSETLKAWKGYERITLPWLDLVNDVNRTLEASASPANDLHWFDSRPILDQAGREGLYADWLHLNRQGATLVAKALAANFRAKGWVR